MELKDICSAAERLAPILRRTPLIRSVLCAPNHLYLKPENLQYTGSFKLRGAYNKISLLTPQERANGVIACSAGNHAQGVAMAARKMGIRACVCMPESAPKIKVESTRAMGAKVVLVPGVYDDAYERALDLQAEEGCTFVHPFNDADVIAGQGTIALEILHELPETDAIVCPVGGGGLISGVACAAKQLKPGLKIYGVQSSGAPSMYASFAVGYVKRLHKVKTFADGIAVKEVGSITFDYTKKYVDDIITVPDEAILEALKQLMNREKLLAEGAGATPVAAVLENRIPELAEGKNVVCVISGGNIDLPLLAEIVAHGLREYE